MLIPTLYPAFLSTAVTFQTVSKINSDYVVSLWPKLEEQFREANSVFKENGLNVIIHPDWEHWPVEQDQQRSPTILVDWTMQRIFIEAGLGFIPSDIWLEGGRNVINELRDQRYIAVHWPVENALIEAAAIGLPETQDTVITTSFAGSFFTNAERENILAHELTHALSGLGHCEDDINWSGECNDNLMNEFIGNTLEIAQKEAVWNFLNTALNGRELTVDHSQIVPRQIFAISSVKSR